MSKVAFAGGKHPHQLSSYWRVEARMRSPHTSDTRQRSQRSGIKARHVVAMPMNTHIAAQLCPGSSCRHPRLTRQL